jgi:hypothetical protein
MRLEDLTIALRPRQSWEAADLGCVLVRRDYGSLLLIWLMGTLPIWLLLAVLLWRWPHAFGLIAWWLKPLYDRLPLYFLSRAAFGSKPSLREMLRVWPSLWRRFLPSSLLWRRFSLMRSFTLPVQLLEGQKGNAARQRIQTLSIDGGSSGAILTWVFLKLEIAIWIGLAILLSTIGPGHSPPNLIEWFRNPDEWSDMQLNQLWFSNLIYLISMTLIEPFYVGAGFGLYLNSRIKIEGWDIELTFRRLASRLQSSLGLLLLLGIFGAAQPGKDLGFE